LSIFILDISTLVDILAGGGRKGNQSQNRQLYLWYPGKEE
jgi:hypothetical protein